jgi:hypothetical protein
MTFGFMLIPNDAVATPLTVDPIYLSFDPGGKRKLGAAVIDGTDVRTATVSAVAEAMAWATEQCADCTTVAAGINTLLHWSDGVGGWSARLVGIKI